MKGDPEQRAIQLGEYIAAHRTTVRAAAAVFGCSKSTVHKDVAVRLRTLQPELFRQVRAVLARNQAERHLRGGAATRRKYSRKGETARFPFLFLKRAACFTAGSGGGTGSVRPFPTD